MNNKQIKNVAIYSRKSKYTGKGESIGNQIEMCREYLKLHKPYEYEQMNIVAFEDEGYSGSNINRPQFQAMLRDIKNHKFDMVICYRLDRISRNTADFSRLIEDLDNLGVSFISIRDNFDTTTPTGRAMMMMVSVFAQLERETIAERIRDNMHELAKTGRWLGGTTPTGYESEKIESISIDGKKKSAYKLKIIDNEIEIIKLIFSKFIETNSLTKTETFLMNQFIKTKNEKDYNRFSIRTILENPVYMIADKDAFEYFNNYEIDIYSTKEEFDGIHGVMAYNKTKQKMGKSNKRNNINDWVIAVGKHKGVISGSDWVKVQNMLYQNKSKSFRKPKSNIALLSGVLICGDCGKFMRPKQMSRFNKDGEKVFHYLCETKEKSRKNLCNMTNINGNTLDKLVCDEIKKLSEDGSAFINELNKAKKNLSTSYDEYKRQIDSYNKNISKNEKAIQRCIIALTESENNISNEYLKKEIERLHTENEQLKNKIEDITRLINEHELSDNDFNVLKDMICNFGSCIDKMNIEEKRTVIRTLVERVVWDGENVHIYFLGSKDKEGNILDDLNDEEMLPLGMDSKRDTYAFEA